MGAVTPRAKARVKARSAWTAMHARCSDPSHPSYHHYGGRGISVCERWGTFAHFLADMGLPEKELQLDRVDNDGNYEPENCRWATAEENMNNRRVSRLYEFGGEVLSVAQWARKLGISQKSMSDRLDKMPASLAFTLPRVLRTASRNRRDTNSSTKIRDCDLPRVLDLLRCGERQKDIGAWFDVCATPISRIKRDLYAR